jgi:DNA-binding Xre family transcriptional regulator
MTLTQPAAPAPSLDRCPSGGSGRPFLAPSEPNPGTLALQIEAHARQWGYVHPNGKVNKLRLADDLGMSRAAIEKLLSGAPHAIELGTIARLCWLFSCHPGALFKYARPAQPHPKAGVNFTQSRHLGESGPVIQDQY